MSLVQSQRIVPYEREPGDRKGRPHDKSGAYNALVGEASVVAGLAPVRPTEKIKGKVVVVLYCPCFGRQAAQDK